MLKKIFYSNLTRALAYLLISVCLTALIISLGNYDLYYDDAYNMEQAYTDSSDIYYELHEAAKKLMEAMAAGADPAAVNDIMKSKPVHYYAQTGELIYTDGNYTSADAFPSLKCGFYLKRRGGDLDIQKPSEIYDYYFAKEPEGDYTLYVYLDNKTNESCRRAWQAGKRAFTNLINLSDALGIALLVLVIYCIAVCGRRTDGSRCELRYDKIYAEVWAALFAVSIFFVAGITISVLEGLHYGGNPSSVLWKYTAVSGSAGAVLSCGLLLPVIRNIKNRKLCERSIIAKFVKWCIASLKQAVSYARRKTGDKITYIAAGGIVVYTFVLLLFNNAPPVFYFMLMIAAVVVIFKALSGLDEVFKGIAEIKNGNTDYKIEKVRGVFEPAAEAVNTIGSGIGAAVEERIRSERMKSELITNVSHDLKTPLTSVISYAELLCREKLEPDKANEYAEIILQKALRLKNLTADLFDISKVQSGNGNFNCTKINLSLLIGQAIGELDEELKKSGLELCTDLPDEAYAVCDGERMSRVFENLLQNAAKYSMKNTRLYVDVTEKGGCVCAAVKNISAYKMDFTGEEIAERFVRGDKSRSTEGSGLGLAIAKSYTEACGGSFTVTVDGDLFKAEVRFPSVKK